MNREGLVIVFLVYTFGNFIFHFRNKQTLWSDDNDSKRASYYILGYNVPDLVYSEKQ